MNLLQTLTIRRKQMIKDINETQRTMKAHTEQGRNDLAAIDRARLVEKHNHYNDLVKTIGMVERSVQTDNR